MPSRLLSSARFEAAAALRLGHERRAMRLVMMALLLAICALAGYRLALLPFAAAVLLLEAGPVLMHRWLKAVQAPSGPPETRLILLCVTLRVTVTCGPVLLLAAQPSVPFMLTGAIWLCGSFTAIANAFISMPVFNRVQLSALVALAAAMFALIALAAPQQVEAVWHWAVPALVMALFCRHTMMGTLLRKQGQRVSSEEEEAVQARLRALEMKARLDPLTGLLSRPAFDEELQALLSNRATGERIAVLLIDLDGFKPINDTYSHEAGDRVLVEIGRRLSALAGEDGVAGRLGGDEFMLAFSGIASEATALRLAQYAMKEACAPVSWGGTALRLGASIGVALTGSGQAGDLATVAALCAAADQAMYRAKADPERSIVVHDGRLQDRARAPERAALEEGLRSGAIRPFYQPKVRLDSGRLHGLEALVRWQHPERGLLPPSAFLGAIEERGLQGEFMAAMARAVLADISALLAEGLDPGQVSLNVTEIALATHSGMADLRAALRAHPQALPHLTLEITEDVFIARSGHLILDSIEALRREGLRISLDDFGTGYASLEHLRRIEFDELKLDTALVQDLGQHHAAEVLVNAVMSIAYGLGIDVIAEGVETEQQHAMLLALGCRYAQGYRFGKAIDLQSLRVRMEAERALPDAPGVAELRL
ncbi:putative bifunctional diguanylate cyclase/phosphodiesterase [Pseudoroseicyclus aestuarii]|uniref:Diguanylate cyclase (GGDEF)-like protein n=1 Tax=Pseudoroseicyclus aestuarii TaxID=1795041 RepID=A0A318T4U0_9RHOB|nr:EAL domain-containing protein [Pseudoroseicyclus aestuarii]PYE82291.1 diguanylate cyclase (GGDEF)-like protein [Pseudoroseicyclus aestuarii]